MANQEQTSDTLVLGIGNLLWADEGFGVRCVEALQASHVLPPGVLAMDGGTQGLYLLPYVQQARRLIVFDAIDYGLVPGTLRRIEDDAVPRFMGAKKMSLHQTGFQEVIAAAELTGQCPRQMLLVGVQPEQLEDFGGSLRPVVRARVAEAVAIAVQRLRDWGHDIVARATPGDEPDAPLAIGRYESGRPSEEQACRHGDPRVLAIPGSQG
jgi:hydrogenase maturation protease